MDELYLSSGYIQPNFYVYTANAGVTIELGGVELSSSISVSADVTYIKQGYFVADYYSAVIDNFVNFESTSEMTINVTVKYSSSSNLIQEASLFAQESIISTNNIVHINSNFNLNAIAKTGNRPINLSVYNGATFNTTRLLGTHSLYFPTYTSYASTTSAIKNFNIASNENFLVEFYFYPLSLGTNTTSPRELVSFGTSSRIWSIQYDTTNQLIKFTANGVVLLDRRLNDPSGSANRVTTNCWNYVKIERRNNVINLWSGNNYNNTWKFSSPYIDINSSRTYSNAIDIGGAAYLSFARYDVVTSSGFTGYFDEFYFAKGFANDDYSVGQQNIYDPRQLTIGNQLSTQALYHYDNTLTDTTSGITEVSANLTATFTENILVYNDVYGTSNITSNTTLSCAPRKLAFEAHANLSSNFTQSSSFKVLKITSANLSLSANTFIKATRIKKITSSMSAFASEVSAIARIGKLMVHGDVNCSMSINASKITNTTTSQSITSIIAANNKRIREFNLNSTINASLSINYIKFKSGSVYLTSNINSSINAIKKTTSSIGLQSLSNLIVYNSNYRITNANLESKFDIFVNISGNKGTTVALNVNSNIYINATYLLLKNSIVHVIEPEDRYYNIGFEDRTKIIEYEDRTFIIG